MNARMSRPVIVVVALSVAALVVVALLLARWSQGIPVVMFQPSDQSVARGQVMEWTFDSGAVGSPPPGAEVFSGDWVVQAAADAPTPPNVLCQMAAAPYPSLCFRDRVYTDLEASVRFKPVSGAGDQAAGILFHVQDADNYYIFRANALEDNLMFFRYASGKRTILKRASQRVPTGQWRELKVEVVGHRFRGFLNGKLIAEVSDETYRAGKVGLWTKADSVTCFDNFLVVAK